MSQGYEITVTQLEEPLREHRNLFRVVGEILKAVVTTNVDKVDCVMDEVTEADFDELDVTIVGIPTVYCRLEADLYAIWPTPPEGLRIKLKVETAARLVG